MVTITSTADSNQCAQILIEDLSAATSGTFTSFPGTFPFTSFDLLKFTATPKSGWMFDHWDITYPSGAHDTIPTNAYSGVIPGDQTWTALFVPSAAITINSLTTEVNSVTLENLTSGTNVTFTSFPASFPFNAYDSIILSITTRPGYLFDYWDRQYPNGGHDTITLNPFNGVWLGGVILTAHCHVQQGVPTTQTLTFSADPNVCSDISIVDATAGTSATFTSFPNNFNIFNYSTYDVLTLKATPKSGYMFDYWSITYTVGGGTNQAASNPWSGVWLGGGTVTAHFLAITAATVQIGTHVFQVAPQPTKRCALSTAILEIADGTDRVHVMGKQNPEITLTIEEVSQAALNDLVDAYENEAPLQLIIRNFDEGQSCRISKLEHKEISGPKTGTYYQADLTLTLTSLPTINPNAVPGAAITLFAYVRFPIEPQAITKTFMRSLVKQALLGQGQRIYSTNVSLTKLHMEGVLTGDYALTIMYNLEYLLYTANPDKLCTPSEPNGMRALLTEVSFSPENLKFFEKQIPFTADFIIVPDDSYVRHPTWEVQIQDQTGVFRDVTDIIDIEVDRQYGGQAAAFKLTLDNSNKQYALGNQIDYMRNVKIWLGYRETGTMISRLWAIIDEIAYTVNKGQGGTVQLQGRDWLAYMMEGWVLDDYSYITWYAEEIVLGRKTDSRYPPGFVGPLQSTYLGHGLLEGTPIGTARITQPNYNKYWGGVRWPSNQTANNTQRAEMLQKLSQLYRMNFFMDAGEITGTPCLVWAEQPRLSMLLYDAYVGSQSIDIDYPLLFQQWIGEDIIISNYNTDTSAVRSEIIQIAWIYGNTAGLKNPLKGEYQVKRAAFISNYNQGSNPLLHPPVVKTWGIDIMAISPSRYSGIPIRNRTEVYGDGVYAIADAASPTIQPSGNLNPGYIPGSDPGLQTKYGKRRDIIEDNSIKAITGSGGINCEVYAYTNLVKTEYPDREVHLLCEGDPQVFPGAVCRFTDNGYTGMASGKLSGYIVTGTTEKMTIDGGYTIEIILSRLTATISPALLSNVIKNIATKSSGDATLNTSKTSAPVVGTIMGPVRP